MWESKTMIEVILKRLIAERRLAGYFLAYARGLIDAKTLCDHELELIAHPPIENPKECISILYQLLHDPGEVVTALRLLRIPEPERLLREYLQSLKDESV